LNENRDRLKTLLLYPLKRKDTIDT